MMSAFAAANTGKTLDGSVQITGLDAGDVVNFYKVVGWDQSSGWVLDETFSGLATSGKDASGNVLGWASPADPDTIKTDVLKYISGIPGDITTTYNNGTPTTTTTASVKGRINSVLAGQIASIVAGTTADHSETVATTATVNNGSVTWNNPDAGLYVALVTPKTTGTVYNPIFVAADYDSTNAAGYSNTQLAVANPSLSYSDEAMAKKTVINVKKTIESDPEPAHIASASTEEGGTATSVDASELLQFKVVTTIPEYSDLYSSAMFKITDTLNGLQLNISSEHPFVIKANGTVISADNGLGGPKTAGDFTNSAANEGVSYVIDFAPAYILGLDAATPIEITYWANVTADATKVINPTDNTVKVEYSNNPNNLTDKGTLIDRTNQYSFSIDADINGKTGRTSSELIKVGIDKDGNPLTEKKTYDNGLTEIPALQGATFALLTAQPAANSDLIGKNATELAAMTGDEAAKIYSNAKYGKAITDSTEYGKLNFKGLDAGTYYLVETKAPDGFIRDTRVVTITITPTYEEKTYTEVIDGVDVSCKAEVLKDYTVTVNDGTNTQTSVYAPVYDADEQNITGKMSFTNITNHIENDENYNVAADHSTLLKNTQGVELPSTGGMGTTILYVGGSILVILAAILLITKRRMNAED